MNAENIKTGLAALGLFLLCDNLGVLTAIRTLVIGG
jgi:hypothetical protein